MGGRSSKSHTANSYDFMSMCYPVTVSSPAMRYAVAVVSFFSHVSRSSVLLPVRLSIWGTSGRPAEKAQIKLVYVLIPVWRFRLSWASHPADPDLQAL